MSSAVPPVPPSAADGLTGPLPRLLTDAAVTALQQLRTSNLAGLTHNEALYALGAAQTLAEPPPPPIDYMQLDQDALGYQKVWWET
jgi:hypothetical protein